MNQLLVDQHDIDAFQHCPHAYKHYHHQKQINYVDNIIEACIQRIFTKEMESGRKPLPHMLSHSWGKMLLKLSDTDFNLKDKNTLQIKLYDFLELYNTVRVGSQKIAAVNFPVKESFDFGTYYTTLFSICINHTPKEIIPVFYTNKKLPQNRNNHIRFASAVLAEQSGIAIERYYLITANRSLHQFDVSMYRFRDKELERAYNQLNAIVYNMSHGYDVPNTQACEGCEFIKRCRL